MAFSVYIPYANMVDLSKATQAQKKRFQRIVEAYCRVIEFNYALLSDEDLKQRCREIQIEVLENNLPSLANKVPAHYKLGELYFKQNKIASSIFHRKELLRLRPDSVQVLKNLAWLLVTVKDKNIRDPAQAVRLAKRACELTQYSRPDILDTLALSYAAAGDFAKAIEIAEKGLQLAVDNEKLTNEIQERIKLYKANKPYYDK